MEKESSLDDAKCWLSQTATGLGLRDLVLNVAGPRESEADGIYEDANRFFGRVAVNLLLFCLKQAGPSDPAGVGCY